MFLKFYELSLLRIRKEKDQYVERLSNGSIQSFEDYRFICGKLQGLTYAEDIIKKIFDEIQHPSKQQNNNSNFEDPFV